MKSLKKELGKWLMDVAKYVATAVVLSSILGGIMDTKWGVVIGVGATVLLLGAGVLLVYDRKKKGE